MNTKVDLKKLRFFTIPHDGGSPLTYPVSKDLMDIQKKVGFGSVPQITCQYIRKVVFLISTVW